MPDVPREGNPTPQERPEKPFTAPDKTDRPAYNPGRGVDQDERDEDEDDGFNVGRAATTGGLVLAVIVALIFLAATSRPDVRPYRAGSLMAPAQPVVLDEEEVPATDGAPAATGRAINLPPLGDVLTVSIVAARDKLDPIRVTEEGDVRRPYWVEQGDSLTFSMRERFIIENPAEGDGRIERVVVRVNGVDFPTDRRDDRGRLLITRDAVERYFDQLRRGR